MKAGDSRNEKETFNSEVIDLSNIDLSAVSELPNAVLHDAIKRVCEELSGDDDASAFFQSSLRGTRATREDT